MPWSNMPLPSEVGGRPERRQGAITLEQVLMAIVLYGYLAYLLRTGLSPHDALLFAACSTAVLGGVSYLPNGLAKLMRALEQ
jgi:hypothetical protein